VQIDNIDQQLLTLLNQRALVAEQVGEVKKREGTPFFRPDRVAQVIEKDHPANPGPLKGAHVAAIWREIMSACLALESPQRVAVLGPEGTFCEQAAIEFFGGAADLMYCANFDEVFHATAAGSAQYGVVGVENSTEGVVTRSLDMFLHTPTHVVGEVSLLVRHNLLRTTNSLDNIEAVLAHPQALGPVPGLAVQAPAACRAPPGLQQCRRRAPGHHQPRLGRVVQRARGQQFGLHIVAHAIQDDAYNRTRFAIICLPHTLQTRRLPAKTAPA
jgi:chorismate mutase/prephenate dehydratase